MADKKNKMPWYYWLSPAALAARGTGADEAIGKAFSGAWQIPEKTHIFSRYRPEVQKQLDELMSDVLSGYKDGAFGFAPIEAHARKQFQEQTVPSLAERFTAMGGGQRSSAFQQSLGQAGAGLESQLAAMGSQYGLEQQKLLQNLLQLGQMQSLYEPTQPGWLQGLLGAAAPAAGRAAATYMGGGF